MTDQEIRELLPATRQGRCNTAKVTSYELSKALASSNASLYAKMANSAHLRSSLTSSNTALATLVHAAMDSGKVMQQQAKDLNAAKVAMAEAHRKLAKVEAINRQLETKVSDLTRQVTHAQVWGRHDRHRLLEVCLDSSRLRQENSRLLHLNELCNTTCKKLRRQRYYAEEQLQSLMADCKNKITSTTTHTKPTVSPLVTQTQVSWHSQMTNSSCCTDVRQSG